MQKFDYIIIGAIASPRILLASGIGDKNELKAPGIVCRQHLPGVEEHLQDHVDSMVTVRSPQSLSIGVSFYALPQLLAAPFKYLLQRMGWWTSNYTEAGGFARTRFAEQADPGSVDADPDIQFHFTPIYRSHRGRRFEFGHGYSLFTCVLRPPGHRELAARSRLSNEISYPGSNNRQRDWLYLHQTGLPPLVTLSDSGGYRRETRSFGPPGNPPSAPPG